MNGHAVDKIDRQHLADGITIPVVLDIGMNRILEAGGSRKDPGLDLALLESRLVAQESERPTSERRVEDRVCETKLQHSAPIVCGHASR